MANDIRIYRGNTTVVNVSVSVSGKNYILENGDIIKFTVKNDHCVHSEKVIEKILTADDYNDEGMLELALNPEDTAYLKTGDYAYDCGLQFADGSFYTFIPKASFVLLEALSEKNEDFS